ncbi:pheromone-processing carboxypeptidase KEX1-like [Cryptomeria japonica]|uniref:pheromone-processing carboxypeptidase KEX1-like n=1 Tax=Cryptomeria japonica TaxID=3369 RepID=UPI0027DA5251|nr:pheromone-processing carboxypeptidase KEX1-like [Cryptomeria japonica]
MFETSVPRHYFDYAILELQLTEGILRSTKSETASRCLFLHQQLKREEEWEVGRDGGDPNTREGDQDGYDEEDKEDDEDEDYKENDEQDKDEEDEEDEDKSDIVHHSREDTRALDLLSLPLQEERDPDPSPHWPTPTV